MCCIVTRISHYLEYCKKQKKLSPNTLRAYHIDMTQFISYLRVNKLEAIDEEGITKEILRDYVNHLLATYAPRTSKRKIACLKAFSVCQRSHFAAVRSGFFDKLTRPAGLFALLAVFICGGSLTVTKEFYTMIWKRAAPMGYLGMLCLFAPSALLIHCLQPCSICSPAL